MPIEGGSGGPVWQQKNPHDEYCIQWRLTNLAKEITARTGRKAEVLPADLTRRTDLQRVESRLASDTNITALV
ncbi:MAG TPA: hypothetical protein VGM27_19635, partial [Acidobacteriaceae bacterium]